MRNGEIKNVQMGDAGEKLEKNFYRASEMDGEAKRKAVANGFKHVRIIELDGKPCAGGYYIRKDSGESDYHFVMKHLFAELDEKVKVEYAIDGKRVDAAFVSDGFLFGIEIERGTNKTEQLAAKIQWLNTHFDRWIFVCSREMLGRYAVLVDNKKSFCFTPKKAKEFVLAAIEQ